MAAEPSASELEPFERLAVRLGDLLNRNARLKRLQQLYIARLGAAWVGQYTHGGLRLGSPTGNPFPPPGEIDTPERRAEADRALHVKLMQLGGGLSVNLGQVDVYASYTKYIWGRDAHNSRVFGLGATWYCGMPE